MPSFGLHFHHFIQLLNHVMYDSIEGCHIKIKNYIKLYFIYNLQLILYSPHSPLTLNQYSSYLIQFSANMHYFGITYNEIYISVHGSIIMKTILVKY